MPPSDPVWLPFLDGLRRFVAHRVPAAEVDDVLQDVLLRLHKATGTLRDDTRAEAWVYGITRRTIADFYRRRRPPTTPLPDDAAADVPPPDQLTLYPGEHDVHEEVLSWLRPMAESLPAPYREALLLADFEGLPQHVVAERLGLSLSGAKSRIQRARLLLGDTLRACCDVEFGPDARATAFRPRTDVCDDC